MTLNRLSLLGYDEKVVSLERCSCKVRPKVVLKAVDFKQNMLADVINNSK